MVKAIPFLWLRDGTHPLAAGSVKPRPLAQAGQIRPAPLVGARKNLGPGRQIDSQDSPDGRQPIRRPGRGPRLPTLRPRSVKIGEARPGSNYPHSPCRLGAREVGVRRVAGGARIIRLGDWLGAPAAGWSPFRAEPWRPGSAGRAGEAGWPLAAERWYADARQRATSAAGGTGPGSQALSRDGYGASGASWSRWGGG
jgi:hypothetical protein